MGEQGKDYCEIVLEAKLGSMAAGDLYNQLAEHRGSQIVLNGSKVEQLGTLCMQILVSASKTWSTDGQGFEIIEPSETFISALNVVGLEHALIGLEEVEGSRHDA